MIATGHACERVDPHLAATAARLWPEFAWESDLWERVLDGRADRAELGLGELSAISSQLSAGRNVGSVRRPAFAGLFGSKLRAYG